MTRLVSSLLLAAALVLQPLTVRAQDMPDEQPPAAEEPAAEPPMAGLAGDWSRHGFLLRIAEDGSAHALWRVYIWCGPGVPEPCDRIERDRLISGGAADLYFAGPDAGEVAWTTDPALLDVGWVTFTPIEFGMAVLQQGDHRMVLCGPAYIDEAPQEVIASFPCGA